MEKQNSEDLDLGADLNHGLIWKPDTWVGPGLCEYWETWSCLWVPYVQEVVRWGRYTVKGSLPWNRIYVASLYVVSISKEGCAPLSLLGSQKKQ